MKTYKKLTATLLLILGPFFSSQAQVSDSGVSMGVKGGLNLSNLYSKDVDDTNVLVGFNAGLYVNAPINKVLSLQPELNFTTKGSEVAYNNIFDSGERKFNLSYIEVPVLFKANFTPNFNAHFGPYFAFLVDANIKNESNSGSTSMEEVDTDNLNKFDAGLSAGVGFDINNFGIGVRYNYGLTTVGKEQQVGSVTYNPIDAKNSNANIYLAYKF